MPTRICRIETKVIPKLNQLALESLHETFEDFTLYQRRTSDIISLLRYVYGRIGERPVHALQQEPIRGLLIDYLGFGMDKIINDARFVELMME